MKTPEQLIREYIKGNIDRCLERAEETLSGHENDLDYADRLRGNKDYEEAAEWGNAYKRLNVLHMKESQHADMIAFLKEKGLYEDFLHWEFGDEESDDYLTFP